ncbi:similar to Saccharomyces cerevisiae YCR028C FEN2 Plasma membrane H+-pantothenate symporter [Geotrichum candidum]|uniref:Similar to Saccharomyces cerevisiae YCR028C FEN2 Plasma membrane H+-pantothenate symporter n=1 Tax=Geotrichum candidum TaxID=1173061 RepID=A0A0J9XAV4_GEOCN|nr:similar to Saccharomyces cerevisiae YCR028C FEN2 Plasma membrane H+-pantothenate symporter [Geotrichum candidum]
MEPSKHPRESTSAVADEEFNENSSNASTVIHKDSLLKRIFFPSANDRSITTQEERRFVRRLDIILMTYGCISYCIKQIDQSNYSSAYVSGMREDLNMTGKEYNWLGTYFTIGYAVALIPSQIMMLKVKAGIWLPSLELIWGILTGLCAIVTDVKQMYAIRFFIGFMEASSWPGMLTVLMNWYTPTELGTRAALFGAAGTAGNMFTGFMQAAIYKNMQGTHGLPGWKWLFIFNCIMTIIVALAGYFVIPDTPTNGGARWMSKEEVQLSQQRMERIGRETRHKFEFSDFKKVYLDYRFWAFALAYVPWAWGLLSTSYFNLWLETIKRADGTRRYSIPQVNLIPLGGYAIQIVTMLLYARISDITGKRWMVCVFQQICGLFGCIVLSVWPSSVPFLFTAFFIMFSVAATGPILMSWMADMWNQYPERRAIITGSIVVLVYANNAWMPLFIWPVTEAPNYRYGYKIATMFQGVSLIGILLFKFIDQRIKKKEDISDDGGDVMAFSN